MIQRWYISWEMIYIYVYMCMIEYIHIYTYIIGTRGCWIVIGREGFRGANQNRNVYMITNQRAAFVSQTISMCILIWVIGRERSRVPNQKRVVSARANEMLGHNGRKPIKMHQFSRPIRTLACNAGVGLTLVNLAKDDICSRKWHI